MDICRIQDVYSMVHLTFHRNKNQHGKSKWWKWLSMLRRSILKLLQAPEIGEKGKTSRRDLVGYLHTYLIPRCYLAFSTVVADGQFSTLGTVLVAVLARLTRAMGFKEHPKSLPEGKIETIFNSRVDTGELVCREDQQSSMKPTLQRAGHADSQDKGESTGFIISDKVMHTTSSKCLKKRRHRANPIDDLFDALA